MSGAVVVGYDESPESADAVRWAALEAVRHGCALDVVHVWGFAHEPHGGAGSSPLGQRVLAAVEEVAHAGAQIARAAAPGVDVRAAVHHGPPAQVLVGLAHEARVLVLGRHGSGRFPGGFLGSVAGAVLAHAPCPVVVVPEGAVTGESYGSVVVGFDGSPGAYGALDAAARAATERGASLQVVTAWSPATETRALSYWALAYPDATPGEVALGRAEVLQEAARTWLAERSPGLEVGWDIEGGRAVEVLTEASRHADLTVVGARGLGGLTGLLLGSVSRGVVHRAQNAVLVTRAVETPA
jgi:nucleotide-binding universal stress UspA family protein